MRGIEHEIVQKTSDEPKSVIPLTNFYGIEIKGFAAEIARLALLIAEFQADSRLISQQAARPHGAAAAPLGPNPHGLCAPHEVAGRLLARRAGA